MESYTTQQVARRLNITGETVRARSTEFKTFLSPTANPPQGRARLYTERDLRVMTLINRMKIQGAQFDDIHLALSNGKLDDLPDVDETNSSILPMNDRGRISALQAQLAEWQSLATDLTQQVSKSEGKIELLKEQLREVTEKNERLIAEMAVLKSRSNGGKG